MREVSGCGPLRFALLAGLFVVAIVTAASAAENPEPAVPKPPEQGTTAGKRNPPEKGKPGETARPFSNSTGVTPPGSPLPPPNAPPVSKEQKTGPAPAGAKESTLSIFMPDGQLKSHLVRVYLSRDINPDLNPTLQLYRSHAITKKTADEDRILSPTLVAPNQEWIQPFQGAQVRRTGTLMLFDLSGMDFGPRAMVRVRPVMSWNEGGAKIVAVGVSEVNVGSVVLSSAYTLLILAAAALFVMWLSWKSGGRPLLLLTGVDGRLSLAQTQIACWTIAVGGVVLMYGMIRLEIPAIPDSLVVLMGASLATGGIGYLTDAQRQQRKAAAGAAPTRFGWGIGDLVRAFSDGEPPELSLAKAQMVFWTLLLLLLFLSKSILDGAIWDIPWQLVALMGFSQAGYLAPKLAQQIQEPPAKPGQPG